MFIMIFILNFIKNKKKKITRSENRTRVSAMAKPYSTTEPTEYQ